MQSPTIQQLKTQTPDSLWHFLAALPSSFEAQLLYGLLLAGALGMIANYTVKWAKDEITGSLWAYLFCQNFKGTMLSFFSYTGLAITSIAANIFITDAGSFVGWSTVMWFGVTNGFAVDAIANKGTRPVWTPKQREEKGKP